MTILVTGATGNVGRLVVDELLAAGATEVRALTVDPARAALPPEVDVRVASLARPEALPEAMEGVERLYLAPMPRTARRVLGVAKQAGVELVVDLSGPEGNRWHAVEEAVAQSGLPWTHLEPGEFMTNALLWAGQIRTSGMVRDAYPDAASAPIALEDIAAVAATVLLEDGHVHQAYRLTGPESVSRREMVRLIGRALGRNIPFVEVSHEDAVAQLSVTLGPFAEWYLRARAELIGRPEAAVDTVEALTGRPAATFAEWAVRHAGAFH